MGEELLLQDFSGTLSAKATSLFYGNALIVAAPPIWLYWRIYQLDPTDLKTGIIFGVTTILAAAAIAFAYKKTKHILKRSFSRGLFYFSFFLGEGEVLFVHITPYWV